MLCVVVQRGVNPRSPGRFRDAVEAPIPRKAGAGPCRRDAGHSRGNRSAGRCLAMPRARSSSLTNQLELCIAEIAVMWILHCRAAPLGSLHALTLDVIKFYPVALNAILRGEAVRGASRSDLRLIYFKGLIVAQTHPKTQMIDAIRRAELALLGDATSTGHAYALAREPSEGRPLEEGEALAHIADALAHSHGSSY